MGLVVLFLEMNRFQGEQPSLSIDNHKQVTVLFRNSGISTLFSPIIIFKSDNSIFRKSIKRVLFRQSAENLRPVSFEIGSESGELRVVLEKLQKLQNFEFVFEFSTEIVKGSDLDLEMSIRLNTGVEIWRKLFLYSQTGKFVRVYFFILLFSLLFLSSLCFLLIQNVKKGKKEGLTQRILAPLDVVQG